MGHFPSVAVVILNWNGLKHLQQFLPGVLATHYPALRVVVADNASTDGSVPWLKQHFPQVQLIIHTENGGFAKGYNQALQQVEADYFVLLNNDVEVDSNWVAPVIELMEGNRNIAAVQPKIRSFYQKTHFEYAGACGGWIDRFGFPFARGRVFDTCEPDSGQYNDNQPVFWASGAAMFVRAGAFREAGGFDEYFFAHQEEIDLCWRWQLAGQQVWVCPQSVVFHVGGGTLPAGNPGKVFLNFRNNLVMMYKNLPPNGRFSRIFMRMLLDGVAAWRFLFSGKGRSFWAVARAHFGFYKWLLTRKKGAVAAIPLKRLPGYYSKSLVWAYFVKKKKTFVELMKEK